MSEPRLPISVEAGVGICRIDRPATRNALDPETMAELIAALESLDGDEDARCLLVAGTDEVFASGAEVRASPGHGAPSGQAEFWERFARLSKPTVAAVSGWALGSGCELALACDMCVAAEKSQFGQPEVTLGLIPGGGGTQRLARVLGKQRTMELVLTGRRFSAEQAFAWGLVNRISGRDRWLQQAIDLAAEVAARAPVAVRLGRQAVLAAEREALEAALQIERELFERALTTEDRIEAIDALREGRPPRFEGR